MSCSDRRRFLVLLAALPLAGCGFTPAYAPGAPAEALRGRIEFADPTERRGFLLVARLEERLGRAEAPIYRLGYAISVQERSLAFTTEGSILRYNFDGRVDYTLTDRTTGAVVLRGSVNSFTAASATESTLAAQAARDDAEQRLMVILADQIATRLIALPPGGAAAGGAG